MTPAALRTAHPEFEEASDAVIQNAIDSAEMHMSEGAWGDEYDSGLMLLSCHYLAMSPYGEAAGLIDENRSSIYYADWLRAAKIVGSAYRVT